MSNRQNRVHRLREGTMDRREFLRLTGGVGTGMLAAGLAGNSGPVMAAQQSGNELIVAITPDPLQMSPWLPNGMPGYSIHYHIYEPTIFRDEEMQLVPVLAESWEQSNPNLMTIKLRPGIKFHNGEPLTSAAVKFSYETITAPDSQALWKSMLSPITSIETPDDLTVLLHTEQPNRALIRNLTLACIMTENIYNGIGEDWATKAIGTGPYKFVEYQPGVRVVLERNEEYWGEKPPIQRITYRIITENGTRIAALKSGDVMMINNVSPDQAEGVDTTEGMQVLSTPTARIIFCGMRTDREVFKDVRVRQAVNYAINKQEIIDALFMGLTEPATGPMSPMVFGAATDLGPWPYDPDRARQLLEEADMPNPKVVFGTANGRYINDKQVGEAITAYLSDVGFDIQFEAPEWGEYYTDVYTNEKSTYDMHLLAWGVINLEPDYQLREHFHSAWTKRTAYNNPEVDQLLDQAAATFDEAQVTELLHQAQALIWEDCPWAWLYFQPEIHGVNERLTNYAPRPDEYIRFHKATLT